MLESAAGEPGFQKEEGSGTGGRRPQGFSKPCERRTEDAPGALTATSLKSRTNKGRLPNAKRPAPANGAGQGQLAARLVLRSAGTHVTGTRAAEEPLPGSAVGTELTGWRGGGRGRRAGKPSRLTWAAATWPGTGTGTAREACGEPRASGARSPQSPPSGHRPGSIGSIGSAGRAAEGKARDQGPRCGVGSRAGRGRGRGGARPGALGPPVTPPGPRPPVPADRQAECPLRAISRPCTFLREASVQVCGPTLNWVVCFLTIEFPHLYF